jgi:hypothetical protein
MATWIDRYTWEFDHPDGSLTFQPVASSFTLTDEPDGDSYDYVRKGSNLLLDGAAYAYIKAIDDGANRCEKVTLTVTHIATDTVVLEAYVSPNAASFRPSFCVVEVEPTTDDVLACLKERWEQEVNILEQGLDRYTVSGVLGELVYFQINLFASVSNVLPSSPPAPTTGLGAPLNSWTISENRFNSMVPDSPVTFEGQHEYIIWVREEVTSATQPPGSGWQNAGGNLWVRPPATVLNADQSIITFAEVEETSLLRYIYDLPGATEQPNGLLIKDVLELLIAQLSDCGVSIVSNLLGVNPDNSVPNTQAYIWLDDAFDTIMVFQKSDVRLPTASNPATILEVSLKRMLELVSGFFNAGWILDGPVMRIEHVSYFDAVNGYDLTTAHPNALIRKDAYSYDFGNMPKLERWKQSDPQATGEISYGTPCANEQIQEVTWGDLYTNLQFIRQYPDQVSTSVGQFWIAVHEFGGEFYIADANFPLLFPVIMPQLYVYNRPHAVGVVTGTGGVPIPMQSTGFVKVQEVLEFHMSDADYFAFDSAELVQTQYGWGKVRKFERDIATCRAQVEVAFRLPVPD